MYKYKKRVGISFILAMAIILGVTPNVNALSNQKSANKACENALFSGNMFTANENDASIKIYAKEGRWNIKYYISKDSTEFDYSVVLANSNNKNAEKPEFLEYVGGSQVSIPVGRGNAIVLIAEPQASEDKHVLDATGTAVLKAPNGQSSVTCKAGNVSTDGKKYSLKITDTAAYASVSFASTSVVSSRNVSNDAAGECEAMKNAWYDKDKQVNYLGTEDAKNRYNAQMKTSFPYCYSSYNSSFEVTASTIKKVRQASLEAYKAYVEFQQKQQDNSKYTAAIDEIQKEGYKELKYSDKGMSVGTLSCKKNQSLAATEKYYTTHQDVQNDACQVDCVEQLQVTYDPPQAVKGGMCFQYKVTVRSKVSCKTELRNEIKWPSPKDSCDYAPICSGNSQETQAGPSEKFDSCINSCDGGTYSQSCINKCYNKVYGTSKKTKSSVKKTSSNTISNTTNTSSVVKLANNNDPYYNITSCKNNKEVADNIDYCANQFYQLKQKEPLGTYEEEDKGWYQYVWKPDSSVSTSTDNTGSYSTSDRSWIEAIKRSSPYYFRDLATAKKTIQSFYGVGNGYNGYGTARRYIIDDGGIKRQRTNTYWCNEVCGFKRLSGTSDCVSTSQQLEDKYVKEFENIYDQLSECTSKAVCKSGVVSSFNIGVDYDTKDATTNKENSGNNSWNATNKSGVNADMDNVGQGDKKMFIPIIVEDDQRKQVIPADLEPSNTNNGINGTCYGKNNDKYWQHYKTTITFPGTWINLKSAKRLYKEPTSTEKDYMREKENYYCVGYDYKPVNEKWWDWKINGVGNINTIKVEKPDNIKAKIKDFGKYNWSLNLNCFYGLSNEVTKCVGKNCNPTCTGGECDTSIKNIKMRTVDQQDLFAGRTGDKVGFNWTSAAQDKVALNAKNSNAKTYGIDPGEYAKKLQTEAKGNSETAYSGNADYSLHLTKANIKELRKYVKNNGYTSYQGNGGNSYKEVSGIDLYYYTSGILNKSEYTTNFKRNTNLGVNND